MQDFTIIKDRVLEPALKMMVSNIGNYNALSVSTEEFLSQDGRKCVKVVASLPNDKYASCGVLTDSDDFDKISEYFISGIMKK